MPVLQVLLRAFVGLGILAWITSRVDAWLRARRERTERAEWERLPPVRPCPRAPLTPRSPSLTRPAAQSTFEEYDAARADYIARRQSQFSESSAVFAEARAQQRRARQAEKDDKMGRTFGRRVGRAPVAEGHDCR